ncbi:MAG: transglutaminase domain-containing protein [Streptosporangiaceae bacterium]|nr:transglutaminase domain-containing protein [Streptosporangiaceae bacterium]MBV9853298.1 transglutaminase domain-containing protein [Streptosporangiaceae bacterium]
MRIGEQATLLFYTRPAAMTSAGRHASALGTLPHDIPGLAAAAQGLLIHEHMAHGYGVTLSETDRASVHIRPVEQLLARIVARDSRPLHVPRAPAARLPGNCRHFTVLMTAALRARGIPARARCGFGGYFGTGMFEDHWVCEYWHAAQRRWILVDAQIDGQQRDWFNIGFDVTDVPRDRFLTAGRAWARCRSGADDPARFGLSLINEAGDWWIAANLMRDAAALCNTELLPWDCWGAMPGPDRPVSDDLALLFDRLAALTQTPDAAFTELRQLCQDERLRVPSTVRNAARGRDEAL